jgi:hypothetical protein
LEGVPAIIDFVERNERRPPSDRAERRGDRSRAEREAAPASDV